jgi:Ca2+-binding EF-hand superfamily protein
MQATSKVQDQTGDTFDVVDKNADGIIEIEEFAVLMLEMNHRCTAAELRACFDAIDSDHDGRVTLEEFRAWQTRRSIDAASKY